MCVRDGSGEEEERDFPSRCSQDVHSVLEDLKCNGDDSEDTKNKKGSGIRCGNLQLGLLLTFYIIPKVGHKTAPAVTIKNHTACSTVCCLWSIQSLCGEKGSLPHTFPHHFPYCKKLLVF